MFNNTDLDMMRLAIDEAASAARRGEMPVGAVVARGDEVISSASNTREEDYDIAGHAEITALRLAAKKLGTWRLTGCTLYATLEPCPMCAGAIAQARLGRVVFGAADPGQGCCGSLYRIPEDPAFPHFCPCDGGVLAEACAEPLDRFFRDRRKKP